MILQSLVSSWSGWKATVMRMTVDIGGRATGGWSKGLRSAWTTGWNSQKEEWSWGELRGAGGSNSLMRARCPFSLSYGSLQFLHRKSHGFSGSWWHQIRQHVVQEPSLSEDQIFISESRAPGRTSYFKAALSWLSTRTEEKEGKGWLNSFRSISLPFRSKCSCLSNSQVSQKIRESWRQEC